MRKRGPQLLLSEASFRQIRNLMNYDLVDLKLFVAVAEAGSVSHGAARVHLAVSSASHRISRLEESLGTPLFERLARGVRLTRAGKLLLAAARDVLARLNQLHADLQPYTGGVTAQVTLWANTNAMNVFLPHDLPGFLRSRPGLRVALREAASPDIVRAVISGEAELGVFAGDLDTTDLTVLPYRHDRLVVIAPPGNKVTRKRTVGFVDVAERPFVTLASGTGIHTFLMAKAADLGLTLDVRIQVQSFHAVLSMVAAGVGYGVVPASCVTQDATVQVIPLSDEWAVRDLRLCFGGQRALSSQTVELIEWLSNKPQ